MNRRDFLKIGGSALAGAAIATIAPNLLSKNTLEGKVESSVVWNVNGMSGRDFTVRLIGKDGNLYHLNFSDYIQTRGISNYGEYLRSKIHKGDTIKVVTKESSGSMRTVAELPEINYSSDFYSIKS